MKYVAVVLLFTLCAFVSARPQKYTTKYDNVNVDQILSNERLLKNYVNCLLNKGKCGRDALELKKILPEAIKEDCAKCNEKQKNAARKVLSYLLKQKRDWYNELEAVYDPQGAYRKKYAKEYANELKKEGITL